MNVQTRAQQLELDLEKQKPSWENTVENIFRANANNLLLEFTATHDYENPNIVDKYRNKIIYRYDLVNFRNDRFSKDVVLVHSDLDPQSRILQALLLNQYKEQVAAEQWHQPKACHPVQGTADNRAIAGEQSKLS